MKCLKIAILSPDDGKQKVRRGISQPLSLSYQKKSFALATARCYPESLHYSRAVIWSEQPQGVFVRS